MNYRRGFQRVYAVLVVLWIGSVLFALPSDRLRFWSTAEGLAANTHGDPNDWTVVKETPLDLSKYGTVLPAQSKEATPEAPIDFSHATVEDPRPTQTTESRLGKTAWLGEVLFGPPLLGYAAIFLVTPWIYRGFRSAKQI